jgi:queuine/archaeosine tRNA-ribosyltransferase
MSKFVVCFQIKPVEYMELISSLRPNLWATLADEVPTWVSEKRNKTSVDRTIKWLDECIALSPVRTIRVCVCFNPLSGLNFYHNLKPIFGYCELLY